MSAFAMMYFQDPSLLQFQNRMQQSINRNNLKTVFNVSAIPKDTQLRDALDSSPTDQLEKIFSDFFGHLQRGRHIEAYQFLDGMYLMPVDGSEYFSSEKVSCPSCLVKKPKKGQARYHHQILQAVIVHPGNKHVIPLAPEAIQNTDGTEKQDCEINAAKRLLKKIRKVHPKLKIILTGDSLYSKQPFIDELKKANMSFILVAKPLDHKVVNEWFTELSQMGETSHLKYKDLKDREHLFEWINEFPLRKSHLPQQLGDRHPHYQT